MCVCNRRRIKQRVAPPISQLAMSALMVAMDTHAVPAQHRARTENGRPSLSAQGHGDARVAAFFKFVRGLPEPDIKDHVECILHQAEAACDTEALADLFVLWASTRDVRGGKGERDLGCSLFAELSTRFPATTEALVPMIPEYGSWKDATLLLQSDKLASPVRVALLARYVEQLKQDLAPGAKPSLAGKWAPREKSANHKLSGELARCLFPDEPYPKPKYRQALAVLNRALDTAEVKMCKGDWQNIDPSAVPAACLTKKRKAFMNLKLTGSGPRSKDEDRVFCAQRFLNFAEECRTNPKQAKMHGRVQHPHEMVKHYLEGARGQAEEDPILEAQWIDMRERIKMEVSADMVDGPEKGTLGKMVPLVDVSGSMDGTPMQVAIALGILISEVAHPAVRDRFLTFETEPQWHAMRPEWSLHKKVNSAKVAKWGGSTDFSRALRLILDACVAGDVPPTEVAELQLVVLSDMQFNAAGGYESYSSLYSSNRVGSGKIKGWDTQYKELVRDFADAGHRSKWKQAYPVPRVIFWNLRSDTKDFPVSSDTVGVDMVSGFSPNLLKLFLSGTLDAAAGALDEKEDDTPMLTMRKALDDPRYNPVREVCASVREGSLAGYVGTHSEGC